MYLLSDYDYELPAHLIAQNPVSDRQSSRLLAMERQTGRVSHYRFHDIVDLLHEDDVLVVNDTRVIPARLIGRKSTGGRAEILLVDFADGVEGKQNGRFAFYCRCLVRSAKKPGVNTKIHFANGLTARIIKHHGGGVHTAVFTGDEPFEQALEKQGKVPLPPYIERNGRTSGQLSDTHAYQTVYAEKNGAVAAPTAGLHFTPELIDALKAKGLDMLFLTLHVSYGTFMPVRENDIRKHEMHSERYHVPDEVAEKINAAKRMGRRIVAVGTTSVRTLEHCADENCRIKAGSGTCDLFIYPGYRFKIVDKIITNFHLPKSTLIMLVSAFAGKDFILNAYQEAIEKHYRFYSYGDAMLIR